MSSARLAFAACLVLISSTVAAEPSAGAPRELTVKVVGTNDSPQTGIELLLCPGRGPRCTAIATTDRNGIVRFHDAPPGVATLEVSRAGCGSFRVVLDTGAKKPGEPFVLKLAAWSTLHLVIAQSQPDGSERPLRAEQAQLKLFPVPAGLNGAGVNERTLNSAKPADSFDVCVSSRSGFDVEVQVAGYYLGTTRVEPLVPFETKTARVILRPLEIPWPPSKP